MFISREGPMFCFVAKIHHLLTKKTGLAKKAQRFFSEKNHTKCHHILKRKKFSNCHIYDTLVPSLSLEHCKFPNIFYFSFLAWSQIWLRPLVKGHQPTYFTKLKKNHWGGPNISHYIWKFNTASPELHKPSRKVEIPAYELAD
jgi:hypothetical protein